jgi:hypothetical protein
MLARRCRTALIVLRIILVGREEAQRQRGSLIYPREFFRRITESERHRIERVPLETGGTRDVRGEGARA